jgi:CubicO group peptidase (beta-lactamase class C family)
MLNHRSGLPDYMHFCDSLWGQEKPLMNEDLITILAIYKPPQYFAPNNGFDYCNSNYALLASVVERVSGKSFSAFLTEKIFDPLDMDHTFIYQLEPGKEIPGDVPVGVSGHRPGRGIPRVEANFYQNGIVGDKGVYSTVEDLFKWDQALYQELLVSESALNEAFSAGSPKFSKWRDNYGFGWRLKADRINTVYHFGWWKGFRSYFIRDLGQEKTIIVLTNTSRSISSSLLYEILDNKDHELGLICPHIQPAKKSKKTRN